MTSSPRGKTPPSKRSRDRERSVRKYGAGALVAAYEAEALSLAACDVLVTLPKAEQAELAGAIAAAIGRAP